MDIQVKNGDSFEYHRGRIHSFKQGITIENPIDRVSNWVLLKGGTHAALYAQNSL